MEYYFEQTQQLRFLVYDSDGKNLDKLEDHDFIGSLEVPPPPPPPRTKWTRRVPHPVLIGHAASLTPRTDRTHISPRPAPQPQPPPRRHGPASSALKSAGRVARPRWGRLSGRQAHAAYAPPAEPAPCRRPRRGAGRAPSARAAAGPPAVRQVRLRRKEVRRHPHPRRGGHAPHKTCPVSTGGGTRRVQLVREGGGETSAGAPQH